MAKMAEINLQSGDYLQAMTWAQLYAHYSSLLAKNLQPAPGYLAELINRISKKYDNHLDTEVLKNVNRFIAAYDANIRTGLGHGYSNSYLRSLSMKETSSQELHIKLQRRLDPAFNEPIPSAGFADYIIAFKPDGTANEAWPIDVVPNVGLNQKLHAIAMEVTVTPNLDKTDTALRYADVPIIFDDERFKLSQSH